MAVSSGIWPISHVSLLQQPRLSLTASTTKDAIPYHLQGWDEELHLSLSAKDEDSVSDILTNPACICDMHIEFSRSLTTESSVLPDEFLGAPQLLVIHLDGTPLPTVPRLLSSSKNFVSLRLENIPPKGYFTPEDLAIGLSTATQLEFLEIGFHSYVFTLTCKD
ncbi:hypothetical protein EDB89DRAFT_2076552 [Lactarius sanguifluus]|nr:hypothetical protein EDB89DRAFT_2076552 [Lactarius sanguifluus]